MNSTKTNKFLTKALNKMFSVVGMKGWDKDFTKQENWFSLKTWTTKQRDQYKKWFMSEIKKDLKLNKKLAEKEWSWFYLMWGWKEEESLQNTKA